MYKKINLTDLSNLILRILNPLLNKKETRFSGVVVFILIAALGVLIGGWALLHLIYPDANPFYIVSSTSMVPSLNQNDILVVGNPNSFENLNLGDIVVFHSPENDKITVHRVIEIQTDAKGEKVLTTKGDANPASIPGIDFPIRQKNFIGKVTYVVPALGIVLKVLSPPLNYIIIGVIIFLLLFFRFGVGIFERSR